MLFYLRGPEESSNFDLSNTSFITFFNSNCSRATAIAHRKMQHIFLGLMIVMNKDNLKTKQTTIRGRDIAKKSQSASC
jgi:hypothetical protein